MKETVEAVQKLIENNNKLNKTVESLTADVKKIKTVNCMFFHRVEHLTQVQTGLLKRKSNYFHFN